MPVLCVTFFGGLLLGYFGISAAEGRNDGSVHMEHNHLEMKFEVFTAMIMKNGVIWDVCGFCKNRCFGGT
jgi:hypothetical protein